MPRIHTLIAVIGAALLMILFGGLSQSVAAVDEHPKTCSEAEVVDASGTFSGTIDTEDDQDFIAVRLQRGDSISISSSAEAKGGVYRLLLSKDPSLRNKTNIRTANYNDFTNYLYVHMRKGVTASVTARAEEDGVHCIGIENQRDSESEIPFEWEVSVDQSAVPPTTTTTATPTTTTTATLTTVAPSDGGGNGPGPGVLGLVGVGLVVALGGALKATGLIGSSK